jgi:hypothetical protein
MMRTMLIAALTMVLSACGSAGTDSTGQTTDEIYGYFGETQFCTKTEWSCATFKVDYNGLAFVSCGPINQNDTLLALADTIHTVGDGLVNYDEWTIDTVQSDRMDMGIKAGYLYDVKIDGVTGYATHNAVRILFDPNETQYMGECGQ